MKLKPAGKIIIALTILAVVAALAWTLGVKDMVQGDGDGDDVVTTTHPDGTTTTTTRTSGKGAIGNPDNPLKVSIVSFHGYAPAILANGGALKTKPGSIFAQQGLSLEFLLQDDMPTMATNFGSGAAHCSWRTVDFFAQEHPGLRGAGFDGKAVMIADNTRGGDAIIARGDIRSVEDLAGKKVALLQYTPSDWLFVNALENSSLSARKRGTVEPIYINPDEGTAGVRAAFVSGQVDAAVLWEPDLALALKAAPNAHVMYSTATATNLIYDSMVCDTRVIGSSPDAIQKFVRGWMMGVEAAKKDPDQATEALIDAEPMFAELAGQEGRSFINSLYSGILWTGVEENIRILGLTGGPNHFDRVYKQADQVWRGQGALADPNSPVINPQDAVDKRFIQALADEDAAAQEAAKVPEFTFTETERDTVVEKVATLTKPVSVNFGSGSKELSKRAKQIIDTEIVPVMDSMGSAYFSVEGNTDSTGARSTNVSLSKQRADAVVAYLVGEWEFPKERFVMRGNGPDKPLCDESNPASEDTDLDGCRGMNRRTDVAVYSR
jgi:outer membrane protein OmpA-like peptidoglycan-associated protein